MKQIEGQTIQSKFCYKRISLNIMAISMKENEENMLMVFEMAIFSVGKLSIENYLFAYVKLVILCPLMQEAKVKDSYLT